MLNNNCLTDNDKDLSEKAPPVGTAHKECLNVRKEVRVSEFSVRSKKLVYIEIVRVLMLSFSSGNIFLH